MLSWLRTTALLVIPCALAMAGLTLHAEDFGSEYFGSTVKTDIKHEDQEADVTSERRSLAEFRALGRERSRFLHAPENSERLAGDQFANRTRESNLAQFGSTIKPLLEQYCYDCHNGESSEGNIRIDSLDPDLVRGGDTDWWSEVFSVVAKGEMPPPDAEELSDEHRKQLIEWLSSELQIASTVRRRTGEHSTMRRMTRYEYNYALQDLLGLNWDFAKDLPPEARSEDGFENSSDLLQLSVSQFQTYYRIARRALRRATVTGNQPPTLRWNIPIAKAAEREFSKRNQQIEKLNQELKDDPEKLAKKLEELRSRFQKEPRGAYFKELSSGRMAEANWNYRQAQYAFSPALNPENGDESGVIRDEEVVAILPHGQHQKLIFELGNRLPDEGTMRVRVRASRVSSKQDSIPSLQLFFGWQASNEGRALMRVSQQDTEVTATADQPQIIQWDVPLGEIYPRNSVRKTSTMGTTPSPSEYIRLVNSSASPSEIQIESVEVVAPVHDVWPPESHRRIFGDGEGDRDETSAAREIISSFMSRAWRRPIGETEITRKLKLFETMRGQCDTFEEAVIEVLASVLSSPQFLYVSNTTETSDGKLTGEPSLSGETSLMDAYALANRLSFFLWGSIPDQPLLTLAASGDLTKEEVLASQVDRMIDDPRRARFAEHFVHQWLNMELLEFQNFKQQVRGFDPLLKEAMQWEPIALFEEVLRQDASVLDFIHCDYAVVNERLARHYGLPGVHGNHFRRIALSPGSGEQSFRRGGLLTQAGLIAMNSDWPDSHPIKRAIWLLENVLDDPPPPPPPAVPQIDLADPEIAKMTLKERIEDHRNHAACMSCHVKIDPWGIAFENYDALGQWRDKIKGQPIDASSSLFNQQTLNGMDGLKRFLLSNRQDQFVRALVTKLTTYALGRPLGFSDQAEIDAITTRVRRGGDGLRTAVKAIVQSDLFRS